MVEEKFLIDSNSFMTPYRQYYAFDLVPTYWKELSKCMDTGKIVLLDMVKGEIDKGRDDLAEWVDKQTGFIICNHVNATIIINIRKYCSMYRIAACIKSRHCGIGVQPISRIRG